MKKSQKPETRSQKSCLLVSGFWLLASGFFLGCQSTPTEPIEPQPAPKIEAQPDPRIAEMQVLIAELLDRMEVMNARMQRLESGAPPAVPTASSSQQPATTSSPRPRTQPVTNVADKYRSALTLYARGQLDNSRKLFQEVLDADANGELADNALYWIAETYFVTAKYSEAMALYRRILTDYSGENKAPDAMYKLGLSYVKLGDLKLARTTFEQLIQKYPYSTPASSAKLEIKRIQY